MKPLSLPAMVVYLVLLGSGAAEALEQSPQAAVAIDRDAQHLVLQTTVEALHETIILWPQE